MASNEQQIIDRYTSRAEDGRADVSRAWGLEFHYTKKLTNDYIHPDSHVLELGCATGYYGLHYADKCAHYTGIDIVPEHIALFRKKIAENGLQNITTEVGDATALTLPDNSFDVVLCLGPMYHLPPEEREKVFRESKRVCKPGGILAYAYISPIGAYMKGMMLAPTMYPSMQANEFVLRQRRDDRMPDLFFYAMPEDMRSEAEKHDLTVLRNAGINFTSSENMINSMSEEQFAAFMEISDEMVEHESCAGLSIHCLLVGRKDKQTGMLSG
jgi:ubiquinone/menaquinone biosynthesis C-methylase UbiE